MALNHFYCTQALAHSTKAEKTPDRILTTSSGGGLYLGGFRGVINTQFLQEANVTHIVNTAKGLEIFGPKYLVRQLFSAYTRQ